MRFARHTHAPLTSPEVGRVIKIKQFEELAKTSPQNAPKVSKNVLKACVGKLRHGTIQHTSKEVLTTKTF